MMRREHERAKRARRKGGDRQQVCLFAAVRSSVGERGDRRSFGVAKGKWKIDLPSLYILCSSYADCPCPARAASCRRELALDYEQLSSQACEDFQLRMLPISSNPLKTHHVCFKSMSLEKTHAEIMLDKIILKLRGRNDFLVSL